QNAKCKMQNLEARLWRFSYGKRRCSAAETESAFAEGKYFLALLEKPNAIFFSVLIIPWSIATL
ncbi:MAG: hypothetical protein J6S71_02245, partial [Clostridia bacterium]|nr:hypothetical protein [Clostridia bacterium]